MEKTEFEKEELRLLRLVHHAAEQMGSARKHDCPGFDCSTCNTTPVLSALNDIQAFYEKWEKVDAEFGPEPE